VKDFAMSLSGKALHKGFIIIISSFFWRWIWGDEKEKNSVEDDASHASLGVNVKDKNGVIKMRRRPDNKIIFGRGLIHYRHRWSFSSEMMIRQSIRERKA
jgi:hypothetical protein